MSKYEREQERLFTRRALLLGGGKLALLGILTGRMFQLQVVDRGKYLTLAEQNRVNMSLIAPERGVIYDRFDVPLAVNVQDFRLLMVEERTPDIEGALDLVNRIIPISDDKRKKIYRDLKRQHTFLPVLIEDNLSWEQMSAIEVSLANLPGLSIEEGKLRSYPLKEATAHTLGYVGFASEADVKKDSDPLLELPGFQIGKNGLEQQYEGLLRGLAGKAEEEVNSTGRQVRTLTRNSGINGVDLRLTMDAELQLFVQARLSQERSACAIVMDAYTGAVYAAASHPAYDPNVFSQGIPYALWNELLNEPAAPLTNKVIAGQYPPGSTFKLMTGLAALHAGATSEYRRVFCAGQMKLGDHIFHCWKRGGHGSVNIIDALAQSCDCYFYQMALDTGIDKIAAMSRQFGLGSPTGIDMPGERGGIMPDQAWKKNRYKQSWQLGDSMNSGIGQGYVLATPLQLATMTARIVNGGLPVKPYFAHKIDDKIIAPPVPTTPINVNPAHLKLLMAGGDAVVNGQRGTAHGAAIKEEGYSFGGKTGTSQVRRITMDERRRGVNTADWAWEEQHHALFVGFAPVGNPRYVCAVVIEHGASGAAAAAPVARDILLEAQKRDPSRTMHPIIAPVAPSVTQNQ